jgi:hypothetical protein
MVLFLPGCTRRERWQKAGGAFSFDKPATVHAIP